MWIEMISMDFQRSRLDDGKDIAGCEPGIQGRHFMSGMASEMNCSISGESWVMTPRSRRHQRVLTCPYCSYYTTIRTNYFKHLRKHTGEKPFSCPNCSYSSTQKSNLERHMFRCPARVNVSV
ncbi:RE1-silencing transcription factor B-like [Penaeus chinensis]|uniref:RE1-silencing transcription factor B-like n=1 Tax=Penaeus chinensis TaxID=139456 RepID=UPI001FB73E91|nr:RE1-silencing transcription factor B-like [Penaeus chinensis]